LNETLDDPTSTNVPTSWRPIIAETDSTVLDLFSILKTNLPNKVKILACQCISHLVNCRHSLFEGVEARVNYVTKIVTQLINFLQTQN
jgi:hypothetical protein